MESKILYIGWTDLEGDVIYSLDRTTCAQALLAFVNQDLDEEPMIELDNFCAGIREESLTE